MVVPTPPAQSQQFVERNPGTVAVFAEVFMHQGRLIERAPAAQFFRQPGSAESAAFIKGELPWT